MHESDIIDIAIPNYNRTDKVARLLVTIAESDNVYISGHNMQGGSSRAFGTVHISDDYSSPDCRAYYGNLITKGNLDIHYHKDRLGAMNNKFRAVSYCQKDFVALIDSDNYLTKSYIKVAAMHPKNKSTIYAPEVVYRNKLEAESWVYPAGRAFTSDDIFKNDLFNSSFGTLLNTGNYIVPRVQYVALKAMIKDDYGPYECMAVNIAWLMIGNNIEIVPKLKYVHDCTSQDGVYVTNLSKSDEYKSKINKLILSI